MTKNDFRQTPIICNFSTRLPHIYHCLTQEFSQSMQAVNYVYCEPVKLLIYECHGLDLLMHARIDIGNSMACRTVRNICLPCALHKPFFEAITSMLCKGTPSFFYKGKSWADTCVHSRINHSLTAGCFSLRGLCTTICMQAYEAKMNCNPVLIFLIDSAM